MNRSLPDITESAPELKDRLRSESVGYKKQRLTAVYLLQSGGAKNRKQVADLIGVNRKTVGQWLDACLEQMLVRRSAESLCFPMRADRIDKPSGFSSYGQIQQFIASTIRSK